MKHTHKLGKSRAGEGTRVWLEGNRLLAAGFKHKMPFAREWGEGKLVLRIVDVKTWHHKLMRGERGTVAGSPDRPIIDITGTKVSDTFPGVVNVSVNYGDRVITITPAKEST